MRTRRHLPHLLLAAALLTTLGCTSTAEKEAAAEQTRREAAWEAERAADEKQARKEERRLDLEYVQDLAEDALDRWESSATSPATATTNSCTELQIQRCVSLVTGIVDGDTLRLDNGDLVRVAGVNAPETYPTTECYGPQATKAVRRLLTGPGPGPNSPMAHLVTINGYLQIPVLTERAYGHPDKDIYGRLLRTVEVIRYSPNKLPGSRIGTVDLGAWLLENGYARYDDYALTHYATTDETRRRIELGFIMHRIYERPSNKGGWAHCAWK